MEYHCSFKSPTIMTKFDFNTLLVQQQDSLRMRALQFTKNMEDANDLVQETLLKAIRYYRQFREGTNLKGWLYTIMKNIFINQYRRTHRSTVCLVHNDDISSKQLGFSASLNEGENRFMMRDIRDALAALSGDYRQPFNMFYRGFKYHEIADSLQIPIGTVKTRIHMARKQMKGALSAYRPD